MPTWSVYADTPATNTDGGDGQTVQLEIMPQAEENLGEISKDISDGEGSVRDRYNQKLKDLA